MSNKPKSPLVVFKYLLTLFYNGSDEMNCQNSSSSTFKAQRCAIDQMKLTLKEYPNNITLDGVRVRLIMNMVNRFDSKLRMLEEDSCTYCRGTVEDLLLAYNALHGYIAPCVCVLGMISNMLSIVVLARKTMGGNSINRFLKWLAITDMMVMLEYVPFAVYRYLILPKNFDYPKSWAYFLFFHMNFSQILHTASISLTLSLAIWRYITIKYPQSCAVLCTPRRCSIALLSCFILPLLLCIPNFLVFKIFATTQYENGVPFTFYHVDADYVGPLWLINFWTHAILIKLLPCFFFICISVWLINALNNADKRKNALRLCNKKPSTTDEPPVEEDRSQRNHRTKRSTKLLVAILILFLITELPQGILGLISGIIGKCFFNSCYNLFGEVMDILALVNGSINFILYCAMSKQFRVTFGKVFKPKLLTRLLTKNSPQREIEQAAHE